MLLVTALVVTAALGTPSLHGDAALAPVSRASQPPPSGHGDLVRAARLLEDGAVREAAAILGELVQREPDNADAHLLLGRALALVPEPAAALAALRRAVELRPGSAESLFALGTALARFGDLEAARAAFERTLAVDAAMAEAHASLGLLLAERQEFAEARRHLARAIDAHGRTPAAASSHYVMAQTFREEGDLEAALSHLTAAIELRSGYAEAYASVGAIEHARMEHAAAAHAFEAAVRLSPENAEARAGLGAAYLQLHRPRDGIPHLEHAVRLRPRDRTARYHLCRSYSLAGRTTDARQCYGVLSTRLADERGDADIAAAKANQEGLALEAAGNLPGALERYQAAVALSPYATVLRRNLALAYCRLGRWEAGIAELTKVLDANPDDQDAIKALYIATEQARRTRR